MDSEILLTINLQGEIGGCVRSVDKQSVTVNATPQNSKVPLMVTKTITHTDRPESKCFKTLKIKSEVVDVWESSECPAWASPSLWKKLSKRQRVTAWIKRFDEGFGVSFSYIE